jgi:hypothetical protein
MSAACAVVLTMTATTAAMKSFTLTFSDAWPHAWPRKKDEAALAKK